MGCRGIHKKGRENAFSGEWVKELENASAKAHISRLEALELQCRQQAETAFGNLNDEVSKHIRMFTRIVITEQPLKFKRVWALVQVLQL